LYKFLQMAAYKSTFRTTYRKYMLVPLFLILMPITLFFLKNDSKIHFEINLKLCLFITPFFLIPSILIALKLRHFQLYEDGIDLIDFSNHSLIMYENITEIQDYKLNDIIGLRYFEPSTKEQKFIFILPKRISWIKLFSSKDNSDVGSVLKIKATEKSSFYNRDLSDMKAKKNRIRYTVYIILINCIIFYIIYTMNLL